MSKPLLKIEGLKVYFGGSKDGTGAVQAVDGVSFAVGRGETFCVVGESGSGKSTIGRAILGFHSIRSGRISFDGQSVENATTRQFKLLRKRFQMVFQDPYGSLNGRLTIGQTLAEPLRIHGIVPSKRRSERVGELLTMVGLRADFADRYPHELSGGQRQRVGIARALAVEPELIVADEPVSALDVSVQAQIINLLEDLGQDKGLSYLLIAHDLAVVRHVADRVAVMYLGRLVELADRDTLYSRPAHPYTQALLSAAPIPDPKVERGRQRVQLKGEIPNAANPPQGCRFHPRCPLAQDLCGAVDPDWRRLDDGRLVACHRAEEARSTFAGMLQWQ